MSRPPSPRTGRGASEPTPADVGALEYLPVEYADLLALEHERAAAVLGRAASDAPTDAVDVTTTFMEMSAIVGHVLSVYQRHLAGESFLSSARRRGSLLRHARRLAYEPDPGLAASGHAVLFAKKGVSGTVSAGLPLASVPHGDTKAQDYETRDDVGVDAALNEIVPVEARRPVHLEADSTRLLLRGVGHSLEAGDRVALVAETEDAASWSGVALMVAAAIEDADAGVTVVELTGPVGSAFTLDPSNPPVLLAHPEASLRQFGADADPAQFPPDEVAAASGSEPASRPKYWYDVRRADDSSGSGYRDTDVYLSELLDTTLVGGYLVRSSGTSAQVVRATAQTIATVALHREVDVTYTLHTVDLKAVSGGYASTVKDESKTMPVASHVSATVTALTVEDETGAVLARSELALPSEWRTGWTLAAPLSPEEPNTDVLGDALTLPGVFTTLAPGRPLVLADRAGTRAQVVTVRRAEPDVESGTTRLEWDEVTPGPDGGWSLADLKVHGNVVRVSHGRTVEEVLGSSDGITPFQEYTLREAPVTVLLGVSGGEPQLEVRVADVRWQRVLDFAESGPEDRHYRTVTDQDQVTTVVFGDGRNGSVPPSGRRNVTAVYRVGLGGLGDVEPPRLSRVKRANPLLDRVVNVTSVSGGAEPADETAIRTQATRWIRTFDRAVSAEDLTDLALTIPGVARAASRWDRASGVVLVVATASGAAPDLAAVRAFLDARRDTTVPLRLTTAEPRRVRITLSLEVDPAHVVENVKDSVRAALHGDTPGAPGMFTFPARGLGQPAFRSELYAALHGLPGVVGIHVDRFEADGTETVADVVRADVHQWLQVVPQDLVVSESREESRP